MTATPYGIATRWSTRRSAASYRRCASAAAGVRIEGRLVTTTGRPQAGGGRRSARAWERVRVALGRLCLGCRDLAAACPQVKRTYPWVAEAGQKIRVYHYQGVTLNKLLEIDDPKQDAIPF